MEVKLCHQIEELENEMLLMLESNPVQEQNQVLGDVKEVTLAKADKRGEYNNGRSRNEEIPAFATT